MKRSDMIKKIKELLDHQVSLNEAEKLLTGMEEFGMNPPSRGLLMVGYNQTIEIHEWEQE